MGRTKWDGHRESGLMTLKTGKKLVRMTAGAVQEKTGNRL